MEDLICFLSEVRMMQCTRKRLPGVEENIFDINGFEIRFFTKSDLENILMATGFTAY